MTQFTPHQDDALMAIIHYVPLHSAPAGIRFGRTVGDMRVTDDVAGRLIRLPLHSSLSDAAQAAAIERVERAFRSVA